MSLPEPKPGLVIRYCYLWAREHAAGHVEGVKDRPCAMLLAAHDVQGDLRIIVHPITHARPSNSEASVEIPLATRRRLGLDNDQSWIVLGEVNMFTWPSPDIRFARGEGPQSVAYGFLPAKLFEMVRNRFAALHEKEKARFVKRD